MMNLKKKFFRDYYEGIDFKKFDPTLDFSDKEEKKAVKAEEDRIAKDNSEKFAKKNEELFKFRFKRKYVNTLNLSNYKLKGYDSFSLNTVYPGLIIGTGTVHETNNKAELKLGFFFDHTTGLPILPGSSIKGVLRSAFPQFQYSGNKLNIDKSKMTKKQKNQAVFIQSLINFTAETPDELYSKVQEIEFAIFEGLSIEISKTEGKNIYTRINERCHFYDAFIEKAEASGRIIGPDVITPHGDNPLRNPTPLPFLKVLPGVTFKFQFAIREIKAAGQTFGVDILKQFFQDILTTLGAGAKTNVGYGQFVEIEDDLQETSTSTRERTSERPEKRSSKEYGNVIPTSANSYLKNDNRFEGEINIINDDICVVLFDVGDGITCQIVKSTRNIKPPRKMPKEYNLPAPAKGEQVLVIIKQDFDNVKLISQIRRILPSSK